MKLYKKILCLGTGLIVYKIIEYEYVLGANPLIERHLMFLLLV